MFGRVSITHGLIIFLTIFLSSFRGCMPKPKDITFVDLSGGPAPAPSMDSEPEQEAEPETVVKAEVEKPKPKPKPKPEPKPEKKPALKPVVTNTPPKKVETNEPPKKAESKKPAVTNAPPKKAVTNAPAKPKIEAERLAEIRKGGKRVPNPNAKPTASTRPSVNYNDLRNALNSAATGSSGSRTGSGGTSSGSGSGSGGGMYSPFAGYYDSVKQQMYNVWQKPVGAPIGTTATTTVKIERDGTVYSKSITRRSGNAQFDQSVQNALNVTVQLPKPPDDLPSRDIEIEFQLSD